MGLLLFCNLIIIVLIFLKYLDYKYEYALYKALAENYSVKGDQLQTFTNFVNLTHDLQTRTQYNVRSWNGKKPLKAHLFRSGDMQLLDAYGDCGSYAHVLAELCKTANLPVRIVQLNKDGQHSVHILIEVKINAKWGATDPMFKTILKNPDSTLASMEDIKNNLEYFSEQFPIKYPYLSFFKNYSYTNWSKVPVFMPLFKDLLAFTKGKEYANAFSIRVYFLNIHQIHYYTLLIIFIPLLLITVYQLYL